MKRYTLFALALFWACSGTVEQQQTQVEAAEPEPVVFTQWADETELFVEYPPLHARTTSRLAIHLTALDTFQPLTEGRVVVELAYGGGHTEMFAEDEPSRPGIFGVNVTPTRAGSASMTIRVASKAANGEHRLGPVEVAEEHLEEAAEHSHGDNEGDEHAHAEEISFLKEQQWALEFATRTVESANMRGSVLVPAKIEPRSGGRIVVSAPTDGRLSSSVRLPGIGTNVQSGQVVAAIVPPTNTPSDLAGLDLAVEEARVTLDFARQELARVERLLAAGAIPARRVTEAESNVALASARLKAARARLELHEQTRQAEHDEDGSTVFQVRSPLSGVVTEVATTDGAQVDDGDRLIEVVAIDDVYVVGEVSEVQAPTLRRPDGAEVIVAGIEEPLQVGGLISVANIVDPRSRTVKVIYELSNRKRRLAVGQAVSLRLFAESRKEGPAIAESAIVDDGGRPVVYTQTGGESFERRAVTLGERQGGMVQVTEGLALGERVVTKGAYLILLASKSTQAPSHGHAH